MQVPVSLNATEGLGRGYRRKRITSKIQWNGGYRPTSNVPTSLFLSSEFPIFEISTPPLSCASSPVDQSPRSPCIITERDEYSSSRGGEGMLILGAYLDGHLAWQWVSGVSILVELRTVYLAAVAA